MPNLPRSHLIAYLLAGIAVLAFGWRQVAHSRAADIPSGTPIAADGAPGGAAGGGAAAGEAGAGESGAAGGTSGAAATGAEGADGAGGAASAGTTGAADGTGGAAPGGGDVVVVHVAGWVRRPGVYRLAEGLRVDDAVTAAGGPRRGAELSQLNLAMELEDGRQILVLRRGAPPGGADTAPGGAATTGTVAPGVAAPGTAAPTVNLNTATLEQLDTLSGVGPVTAANIVAYRDEHGGFGSIDELGEIPGIGPVRLESLRAQVTL